MKTLKFNITKYVELLPDMTAVEFSTKFIKDAEKTGLQPTDDDLRFSLSTYKRTHN